MADQIEDGLWKADPGWKGGLLVNPKDRRDVDLQTTRPAAEVLRAITTATEREILPFVSASTYPQQRQKGFVSKVSGNRFRIWKVPSSSRSRQNICIPYLRGVVTNSDGGSHLMGSFALHPFNKVLPLLPWIILIPGWLWAPRSTQSVIFFSALSVLFLVVEAAMVRAVVRILPNEQQDIVKFLLALFPDSLQPSTRDSAEV